MTQGKYAIVDPDDFYKLSQHKWCVKKDRSTTYAHRAVYKIKKTIMMHRQIMHAKKNILVDHINRNGLDNRKANLRFATCRQNVWNSANGVNRGASKYKGVWWDKNSKRWRAALCYNNNKRIHLGGFDDEREAAAAYDAAAKEYRGEYAFLNLSKSKRQNFYTTTG